MPRPPSIHPEALLLAYRQAGVLGCELHGFGWYNRASR